MQTEHNLLADPCPPNSMLKRLAHNVLKYQQLKNENLDDLIDYPYLGMDREAKKLGLSAKELVQVYQKCVSENPEPSAPPMDGGRRRSRKYKNRRSSKRSKRCKRSRRRN